MNTLALLLLLFPTAITTAQTAGPTPTLTGDWMTPNKSVIRVFPCSGDHLCARIVTIGPKGESRVDVNNPDASLRSRALCGLTIGTAFTRDGGQQAKDGKIYDPESGKTYSAKMQADGNELNLRGFIGISLIGRTETWHRTATTIAECR